MEAWRKQLLKEQFGISPKAGQAIVALAGNPNVGKSTIFNCLTGLHQYTGNWPGKTVNYAQGVFSYLDRSFLLIDLPGTYSLLAHTMEEEIARDFLCFAHPDVAVIVLDATSLERNLNMALQVMEITSKVVICINLIDEARKKQIDINIPLLQEELGVPVVAASARLGYGLDKLKEAICRVAEGEILPKPRRISYSPEVEEAVEQIESKLEQLGICDLLNSRWVALRLLDSDDRFIKNISAFLDFSLSLNKII